MSLYEQMANIGSEYERAKRWKEKGSEKLFWGAVDRMLELLDMTIDDKRWHNHRLKELCRLREMVLDELLDEDTRMTDFSKYFMQFSWIAR
ncbi:hypothetical protein KJ855_00185 [Patescibacteria group bacterium]|nr:hypothetical protein [Patescibacteria group bacterium]